MPAWPASRPLPIGAVSNGYYAWHEFALLQAGDRASDLRGLESRRGESNP
jgi:hypothetical protein